VILIVHLLFIIKIGKGARYMYEKKVIIPYFSYLFYIMSTQWKVPSMVPRFPCSRSINVRST